jgi:hypothetical protein
VSGPGRSAVSDNPYSPPQSEPLGVVLAPRPPLAKVAVAYGIIGTLTAMLLSVTIGPLFFDFPLDLSALLAPWLAAGTASFVVPTLVHAVWGRRLWGSRHGRLVLAFLSVVLAVEACLVGDLIVVIGIQGRDVFSPPLRRMLLSEAILGFVIAPVGMLPAWWVGRPRPPES